ncbi:hypothetical protein [Cryptosporangium minutisporangium]|uniref:Uncharacterized protein n=1 Tax=Cryptosporangium minutisporangium TaxID=113569 RepID=A0ABP6TAT4_9ACTN
MSSPHSPQPVPPFPPRTPGRGHVPVLAGIAGLLVGAFAVGAVWLGTSLVGDDDTGPAADAATACQILDGIDTASADALGMVYAYRISAASQLAAAAAKEDRRYQGLASDTHSASQAAQYADIATANKEIEAARAACADL